MDRMKSKQQGAGLLGWLTGLIMVGLVLTMALKLVPIYLDDYALKRVVSSLDDRVSSGPATVQQVQGWIDKGLQTNLIKMQPNEIRIFVENRQVVVDIDYERRLKFLYNIDLIATFKHDWKAENR